MLAASDPTTTAGMRDRAALVLGFAAMRRGAELVALDLTDVTETPDGLIVFIRTSKTDPNSAGREVMIPFKSRPATCPVRIVRAWRTHLAEHGITTGRLVRSVDRHGRIGESLSTRNLSVLIRRAALRADLPDLERYSAHSLRAGGATAAASAGVPAAWIAEQGGWAAGSRAVHGYIRAVDGWRDNAMPPVDL
jgi:integrase